METCKKFYEKILLFDDLSTHEQLEVKQHTANCDKCRKQLEKFQMIISSLKRSQVSHVTDDTLLLRYGIHISAPKEPDYDGRKLTRSEVSKIRKHLAECSECMQKVDQFCQEYQEIDDYLEKTDFPTLSLAPKSSWSLVSENAIHFLKSVTFTAKSKIFVPIPKFYPIAAGAMAVILLMILVGPFFRGSGNPYLELASLEQEEISLVTRSSISLPLNEEFSAFHERDYKKAIQNLERFITNNSTDPSIFYAHYLLGISYLIEAKSGLLGRFQKYDTELVDKGIENLQMAETLIVNIGIKEECYWYIGKAYLMKSGGENAKAVFEKVLNMRGRRYQEAKQTIKEIDNILND